MSAVGKAVAAGGRSGGEWLGGEEPVEAGRQVEAQRRGSPEGEVFLELEEEEGALRGRGGRGGAQGPGRGLGGPPGRLRKETLQGRLRPGPGGGDWEGGGGPCGGQGCQGRGVGKVCGSSCDSGGSTTRQGPG